MNEHQPCSTLLFVKKIVSSGWFDLAFREKDCFTRVVRLCFSRKRLFHQGGVILVFAKKRVSPGWCDLAFCEKEGFTRVVRPCFSWKRGFHQGGSTLLFAKKRISPGRLDPAFCEKEGCTHDEAFVCWKKEGGNSRRQSEIWVLQTIERSGRGQKQNPHFVCEVGRQSGDAR